MLWLTWRQHRAQLLVTLGFLAVLGGVLFFSGQAALGAANGVTLPFAPSPAGRCRRFQVTEAGILCSPRPRCSGVSR